MNAGCFGGEIAEKFLKAKILTKEGEIRVLIKKIRIFLIDEVFSKKKDILYWKLAFLLKKNSSYSIFEGMERSKIMKQRTQPLGLPSTGCFFKGNFIIYLHQFFIKHYMLGYRIGNAMVSTKNANFLVNMGNVSS